MRLPARNYRFSLAGAVFAACTAFVPPAVAQQAVVAGATNDYQASVISLHEAPDSRLLVFERLDAGLSGDLWATRSEDGGASWSIPTLAIGTVANERHAALVQIEENEYAMFFLRDEGGGSFRIHRATSSDGIAWDEAGRVELGWPGGGEINPHVVRRDDGTMILTYHRLAGAAFIAVSNDDGASWDQLRTQISAVNAALPRLAVRETDGKHLLVYQTGSTTVSLWVRTADDPYGFSDTPRLLTPDGNNHDALPIALPDGTFAMLWSRVIDGGFQLVSAQSQDGVAWRPRRQHSDRPGLDNIQPHALAGADDGTVELYWGAAQTPGSHDIVREASVLVAEPPVFEVDVAADTLDLVPGDGECADASGNCSLRAAVIEANAWPGRQRIELPAGDYVLSRAGALEDAAATGDLDLLEGVELVGAGATASVIDADELDRVFDVGPGDVPVDGVAISAVGLVGGRPPGIPVRQAVGGGLRVGRLASVDVVDSRIAGNFANNFGGGIFNYGELHVRRSAVEENAATGLVGSGGGLATGDNPEARVEISDSVIRDNTAVGRGGGVIVVRDLVSSFGSLRVERSALVGNVASSGGAFYADNAGTFVLESSTVSGNEPGGLFIDNFCDTTVRYSTIAANVGGPGYINVHGPANPNLAFEGSLVADNLPEDCSGLALALGSNLFASDECTFTTTQASDRIGVPALLGPLQDPAGPSPFHAPAETSPAIDGAVSTCPAFDQRGATRPADGDGDGEARCDIGAIERAAPDAVFRDGFEPAAMP